MEKLSGQGVVSLKQIKKVDGVLTPTSSLIIYFKTKVLLHLLIVAAYGPFLRPFSAKIFSLPILWLRGLEL